MDPLVVRIMTLQKEINVRDVEIQKQKHLKKEFREALEVALEIIKRLEQDVIQRLEQEFTLRGTPTKKVPVNITIENGGTLCIKA